MSADYGLWPLVIIDTAIFVLFAASFFHPRTKRDWRVMGSYSAFLVALFTEMYGFPLTIYLLAGPLGSWFPLLREDHAGGHLWNDLIGWQADPHVSPFHLVSYVLIGGGFWLIASAWRYLYAAARAHELATGGPYSRIRHPQYVGFLLVMIGLLVQWPTLPTLLMFPVLVTMYRRLARSEEREVAAEFGQAWTDYAARTPGFIPRRHPPHGTTDATRATGAAESEGSKHDHGGTRR